MMTVEEKIRMYKGKKAFIDNLSVAFEAKPRVSSVDSIEYEVWYKEVERDGKTYEHFVEYLIVNFFGGGKSVKLASGNSCTANFRILGPMLNGGYYDEARDYETLADRGFKFVPLNTNMKLDKLLSKPMTHISEVRACFNYCRNSADVERVIKAIPSMFGSFEVDYSDSDEEGTFVITNDYEENGDLQTEVIEYEFWEEEF